MSADYDFTSLSPCDFETLIRDLLQEELGITLESFAGGRDEGIDFRFSECPEKPIIVQCKHYTGAFSTLKSHLKRIEQKKVEKLHPSRYIIATSLSLTPNNKEEIRKIFRPYIRNTADIIGRDDINNLLGKFGHIETRHYKLWISSTAVLERFFFDKKHFLSQLEIDKIATKAKFYVHHSAYLRSKETLDSTHCCVIVGIPGIGKSTLAEMLILDHLQQGYSLVKISDSLENALEYCIPSRKTLFYFDDFLGATHYSNQRNSATLQDFIDLVSRTCNYRFILTTREYILEEAKQLDEKIDYLRLGIFRSLVSLEDYSRLDRLHLLMNHVYHSDLPDDLKSELLSKEISDRIVAHRNFSPRIVEQMVGQSDSVPSADEKEYIRDFIKNLDNPVRIWAHAFRKLSVESKSVMFVLASMPPTVSLDELERGYKMFVLDRREMSRSAIDPIAFKESIRQLQGDYISCVVIDDAMEPQVWNSKRNDIEDVFMHNSIFVSVKNTSVLDFISRYVFDNESIFVSLLSSAVYFEQCIELWRIENSLNQRGLLRGRLTPRYIDCLSAAIKSTLGVVNCGYSRGLFGYQKDLFLSSRRLEFVLEITKTLDNFESEDLSALLLNDTITDIERRRMSKTQLVDIWEKLPHTIHEHREWLVMHKDRMYPGRHFPLFFHSEDFAQAKSELFEVVGYDLLRNFSDFSDFEAVIALVGASEYYDCSELISETTREFSLYCEYHLKPYNENIDEGSAVRVFEISNALSIDLEFVDRELASHVYSYLEQRRRYSNQMRLL